MTVKSNHVAGGVTILLAIVAAVAAEHYSANRRGEVHDATTDVRYAFAAAPTYAAVIEVEAKADAHRAEATKVDVPAPVAPVAPVEYEPVDVSAPTSSAAIENAVVAAPGLCSPFPIPELAAGSCGWYRAKDGDVFHPKAYAPAPYGWGPNYVAATPGRWYFAYGTALTHVALLPCNDARVTLAVASGRRNVFCETTDGGVRQHNEDDAALTPLLVFSEHDRLEAGR